MVNVPGAFIPERGDIVWLTFDPQAGREQSGRRPALILSPSAYNGRVGLALMCPITNRVKGYPFEVALPADIAVEGVVLSDQLRSLDWRERRAELADSVSPQLTSEVLAKVNTLLQIEGSD